MSSDDRVERYKRFRAVAERIARISRLSDQDSDAHVRTWKVFSARLSDEQIADRRLEIEKLRDRIKAAKAADRLPPRKPDDDVATPERLAKAGDDVEDFVTDTGRKTKRVNAVLDSLRAKRAITDDQYNAGNQIDADFHLAGRSGPGAIDPSRDVVDGGKKYDMADYRLDAEDRFKDAIKQLSQGHLECITNVVLLQIETLADFGSRVHRYKDRKDASVAGASTLRDALSVLDFYYYGRRSTRTQSAHSPDYRPSILPEDGGS